MPVIPASVQPDRIAVDGLLTGTSSGLDSNFFFLNERTKSNFFCPECCCVIDKYNGNKIIGLCARHKSPNFELYGINQLKGVHEIHGGLKSKPLVCDSHYQLVHKRIHPDTKASADATRIILQNCLICDAMCTFSVRVQGPSCSDHTMLIGGAYVALPCTTGKCGLWNSFERTPGILPEGTAVHFMCTKCSSSCGFHFITKTGKGVAFSCAHDESDPKVFI